MDLSKVKGGQLIAAIGGIVLLISLLFLSWFGVAVLGVGADYGAWDGQGFLGTLANLVILAAGVAAVALAALTAGSRTVALPVATSALTAALGIAAVVLVVARMLLQPGPNEIVDLKFGIFLALVGAAVVAFGGWQSMQEEGTTFADARDQLQSREAPRETVSPAPPNTRPPAPAPQQHERPPTGGPPPPPRPPAD